MVLLPCSLHSTGGTSHHPAQVFLSSFATGFPTPFALPVPTFPLTSAVLPGAIFGNGFFPTCPFTSDFPAAASVLLPCEGVRPEALLSGDVLLSSGSRGRPTCALTSAFLSPPLLPKLSTPNALNSCVTCNPLMVRTSRSCFGNDRIGELVLRSWRGVRGACREEVW